MAGGHSAVECVARAGLVVSARDEEEARGGEEGEAMRT